jgi:hypothetical protein
MTDPATAHGADLVRGRLMKASLAALLDRVRGSREALPLLAALETALGTHGAGAIEATPERWRSRMCAQLSSLPLPEDDAPLLDLQQRLLASLAPRPPAAPLAHPLADPLFDPERTVVVREISHSEFMNLSEGTPRTQDSQD